MTSTLVPVQRLAIPERSVDDWLNTFGLMFDVEIAHYLRDTGILGTPGDPHDCGLAVFFHRVTGTVVHVSGEGIHSHRKNESWVLPTSCRNFVRNFDHGHYPYLYHRNARTQAKVPELIVPSDFWDGIAAKFKSVNNVHGFTYFGVPVNNEPAKVPELIGA